MILKNGSLEKSWDSKRGHMQASFCAGNVAFAPFPGRYKSYVLTCMCLVYCWNGYGWWAEWCFDMLCVFGFFHLFFQWSRVLRYVQEAVWSLVGQPWTTAIFCCLSLNKLCVTVWFFPRDEQLRPACNCTEHTCVLSGRFVFIPWHFATSADACFHFLPPLWRGDLSLESILWETRQGESLAVCCTLPHNSLGKTSWIMWNCVTRGMIRGYVIAERVFVFQLFRYIYICYGRTFVQHHHLEAQELYACKQEQNAI